jgi:hypothetical protein
MERRRVTHLAGAVFAFLLTFSACGDADDASSERSPGVSSTAQGKDRNATERPGARENRPPTGTDAAGEPDATPFSRSAWRQETIERFGPERTFSDGSKENYVDQAEALCAAEDRPDYDEDSIQRWMEETFCPHT